MTRYSYHLLVVDDGESCTATIDGVDSPLRGYGKTPVEALTQLVECLKEWPITGADRWLATPDGTALARSFCPTFEPGKASEPS